MGVALPRSHLFPTYSLTSSPLTSPTTPQLPPQLLLNSLPNSSSPPSPTPPHLSLQLFPTYSPTSSPPSPHLQPHQPTIMVHVHILLPRLFCTEKEKRATARGNPHLPLLVQYIFSYLFITYHKIEYHKGKKHSKNIFLQKQKRNNVGK